MGDESEADQLSTRKLGRAVRLPESDLPTAPGDGTSKSAASRRFVALSAARMAEWMAADLSRLDPHRRLHSSSIKLFRDGFGVSLGVSIPAGPNWWMLELVVSLGGCLNKPRRMSQNRAAVDSPAIEAVGRIFGRPVPGSLHHQYVWI